MKRITCILFSLLALSASAIELARVNGEIITDADMKAAFIGKHGGHTVFLGGDVETRRFLDIVINERLLVQEAYNLGLDADPAIKPLVDDYRERLAAEHLLKLEIDEKSVPSKEEIRAAWELADQLFIARELVVATRAEAESLRRAILGGADFGLVARACSAAPSRSRAGNLAPFTWGSLSVEIENAVFPLQPGELSPVFETGDGWSVLYLVDRVEAHRPPLDDKIAARIAAKLTERRKAVLTKTLADTLWKKYGARIELDELAPAAMLRAVLQFPDSTVASWNGGKLTAKDSFTQGELRMYTSFPPAQAAQKVRSTLQAAVNTALVRLEARERNIAEVPEVAEAVAKHEAKLVEGALYVKHVLTGVTVADEDVRKAYEEQKASLTLPEKRRLSHIAVATEGEAKKLLARIRKGEDFGALLKAHTLDKESVKQNGDLGWIEKGKVDPVYDPLFALPAGGVAEPIKSPNAWHLVRVDTIAPAHPLAFDEAKDKIRTTLLEKKKHDARQFWIEKLRAASEIEVSDQGVKEFVAANPYEEPQK